MWDANAPQGNESAKIKYEIVPYTRGRGLDLGCGIYKTYRHFIGVDNLQQYGSRLDPINEYQLRFNVDILTDCKDLSIFSSQSMDFVFSSHLLEHIEDHTSALKEWWRVIKPNGYLILYLPHADYYPKMGSAGANPDHKHDFHPEDIIGEMIHVAPGWDLIRKETRAGVEDNEYSFLQVYQKLSSNNHLYSYQKNEKAFIGATKFKPMPMTKAKSEFAFKVVDDEKRQKTCAVVRYGGIGDQIMASSILPHLKNQGYHVTFFTVPKGYDILKHDPHIDAFFIQDPDQVPNEELPQFWECWCKKFDKWINLSESIEGTLLALPGRTAYFWPHSVRQHKLNDNYLEFTHMLAEVPIDFLPAFYPNSKEKKWADKQYNKISEYGEFKIILWVLSGSSVHKAWPYLDSVVARIMLTMPNSKIVFVGDELTQILEVGWENEPRVIRRCGKWNIRETLTFAMDADLVIGPETGVMNAVAMLDMPKIIHLSHSSPHNLTKHWKNTIALCPESTPCWPCHKMIYGFKDCTRDPETGGALCQANIGLETMVSAIKKQFELIERQEGDHVRVQNVGH